MSYYSWKKRPPREFKGKPQWTLDEVYIPPFTARRRYDEEGVMHYDKIERNLHPTGVEVMDHYLRRLSEGKDITHVGACSVSLIGKIQSAGWDKLTKIRQKEAL